MQVTTRRKTVWAAAVVALAGCGHTTGETDGLTASVALQPEFPAAVASGAFELAVDRVRIRFTRSAADVVLDTMVLFPPNENELSVRLRVPIRARSERLAAYLELRAAETLLFAGLDTLEVSGTGTTSHTIPLLYIGPGSTLTEVRIVPRDTALQLGDRFRFGVTAASAGQPVDRFYVAWSTSDPALATVDAFGTLQAPPSRSQVFLHAVTPNGVRDSTRISFSPPARHLVQTGGDGQTGMAGTQLPVPLEVRALAEDELGVPGVRVEFRGFSGSEVRDPLVITDDEGYARTFAILGPIAGPQAFEARVADLPTISFLATAEVGPPSRVVAFAGHGQVDTVGRLLRTPLVARVSDATGNPIPGVTVTWEVVQGSGTPVGTLPITNFDGLSSTDFILGPEPGFQTVRARLTVAPAFADFLLTALPGPGESLLLVSGNGQADTAAATLAPFLVAVFDGFGNPAAGAAIRWNQVQGGGALSPPMTLSNEAGIASTVYRLPTTTGSAHVIAEIVGKDATVLFASTVRPASPFALTVLAGDAQSGPVLSQLAPFEVRVTDRFNNPVPGATVTWLVTSGDGSLSAAQTAADQGGIARVVYRLGPEPGPNTVLGRISTGAEVRFSSTATP